MGLGSDQSCWGRSVVVAGIELGGIGTMKSSWSEHPGHVDSVRNPLVDAFEIWKGSIAGCEVGSGTGVTIRACTAFNCKGQAQMFTRRKLGAIANVVGGQNHAELRIGAAGPGQYLLG